MQNTQMWPLVRYVFAFKKALQFVNIVKQAAPQGGYCRPRFNFQPVVCLGCSNTLGRIMSKHPSSLLLTASNIYNSEWEKWNISTASN